MPTKRQILDQLKQGELLANVEYYELPVADRRIRALLIEALASSKRARIVEILEDLPRDRLKEICHDLDLDDKGRAKAVLVERITGKPSAAFSVSPPGGSQVTQTSLWSEENETEEAKIPDQAKVPDQAKAPAEIQVPALASSPPPPVEIDDGPKNEPTSVGLLRRLTRARLVAIGRDLGVALSPAPMVSTIPDVPAPPSLLAWPRPHRSR